MCSRLLAGTVVSRGSDPTVTVNPCSFWACSHRRYLQRAHRPLGGGEVDCLLAPPPHWSPVDHLGGPLQPLVQLAKVELAVAVNIEGIEERAATTQ